MHPVSICHLKKSFADKIVFNDINLTIDEGEFLTLLGPSGCGKSTLLRSLAGLTSIDSGEIYIGDQPITHMPVQKRGIGMVFQSYALFPNLNVFDNIAFGLKLQGLDSQTIRTQVQEILELVELTDFQNQFPKELSGGQQQRVALARSLVVRPKVLLLDEPLSALDARIRKHLREQIRAIQQELKLTTIFVTHDQEEALTLSDRIALMHQGEIIQCDAPEQLYLDPINQFAASFMGQYNLLDPQQASQLTGQNYPGVVAIRPESIYFEESGRTYPDHFTTPLKASVLNHQLLGSVIRYQVNCHQTQLTVDLLNRRAERLYAPGTYVNLRIDCSTIRALKA
ncbi:ABC transporter ATP-binding protein [Celerinatantimonas sp. YJH-8]|uniref:ABC transporter ATP-binding protein n=1 Tax=Celerinatantimonas sp. YJH-8 TaxID=3228714 RepID=UPI0038CA95E1